MWSTPLDLYCERLDPSFWAEPVNAISNVAFLIAAWLGWRLWQETAARDRAVLALIGVVALIGLGSFAFHTLATRGAMLLDVVPIGIFIYGYLLFALKRCLGLSWGLSLGMLAAFALVSMGLASIVPRAVLNGSTGYFPALAALVVIGILLRGTPAGRAMLMAAPVFVLSIGFRIVDPDVCARIPVGTHFLWHGLNAVVLYLLLRGAIRSTTPVTAGKASG